MRWGEPFYKCLCLDTHVHPLPQTFRSSSAVVLSALLCHVPAFPVRWVWFAEENKKMGLNHLGRNQ